MELNYKESLDRLLLSEGGYTNEATDPGGPTNFGITIFDAQMYAAEFGWKPAGYKITAADVKAMPRDFALKVYRAKYWDSIKASLLPGGVDFTVFDYGVNSGISRSVKVLQRVLGINADGRMGQATLDATMKVPAKEIITEINLERLRFLQSLRIWPTYKNGWTRRVKEVNAISLRMAAAPLQAPAPEPVPDVLAPNPGMAKGTVPAPTGLKTAIKTAAPVGTAGVFGAGGAPLWHWLMVHPLETGLIVTSGVILTGAGIRAATKWHTAKQDAPASGWQSPKLLEKAA